MFRRVEKFCSTRKQIQVQSQQPPSQVLQYFPHFFFPFNFISESWESLAKCQVSIYTFPWKLITWKKETGRQRRERTGPSWKFEPQSCMHSHSVRNRNKLTMLSSRELYLEQTHLSDMRKTLRFHCMLWGPGGSSFSFIRQNSHQQMFPKFSAFLQGDISPFNCPSVDFFHNSEQLPSYSNGIYLANRLLILVMIMATGRKDNKWNISFENH